MAHECPAPRCDKMVIDDLLTCNPHWRIIPADLRRAIWRNRSMYGAQSTGHIKAMNRAVRWLEVNLAEKEGSR